MRRRGPRRVSITRTGRSERIGTGTQGTRTTTHLAFRVVFISGSGSGKQLSNIRKDLPVHAGANVRDRLHAPALVTVERISSLVPNERQLCIRLYLRPEEMQRFAVPEFAG